MPVHPSRTVTVTIERSAADVYAFASNAANLPQWSFIESVEVNGAHEWVAKTPEGSVTIRFTAPNELGVIDHFVRVNAESEVYSPMRVIENGTGSEVIFTVYRLPEMSDEDFERDIQTIKNDLEKLRQLMEK